jgi:hypothetical protein
MDETDVKINFAARAVLRKWPSVTTNELAPPQAAQRWPERIVLDTSQPTIVPAPQQTAWNDIPPKPLDAQAQMQVLPSKQAVASVKSKRRVARRVQRTRVAAIPAALHEGFFPSW